MSQTKLYVVWSEWGWWDHLVFYTIEEAKEYLSKDETIVEEILPEEECTFEGLWDNLIGVRELTLVNPRG